MAKKDDMFGELAKVAAQYMAIKASTQIGGGGLAGMLLSSVAMKGVERIFEKPKADGKANPNAAPGTADNGPEDVGKRIGDAAAAAIERILRERFPGGQAPANASQSFGAQPGQQPATARAAPPQGSAPAGPASPNPNPNPNATEPALPRPADGQSARDYVRGLTEQQREIIRNSGKQTPQGTAPAPTTAPPQSAGTTAAAPSIPTAQRIPVAQRIPTPTPAAGGAAAAAGGAAGAGGAGAGAGAGGAGAAAGGAGAAGGAVAAAGPLVAVAGLALAAYEAGKALKDMAYAQEQYSRKLGEVNPTIAGQNAELDFNRIMRDMQSGDKLAGSNAQLTGSIDRFEKALRPFEDVANLLKNVVASDALNGMANTLELIKEIGSKQYDVGVGILRIVSGNEIKLPWSDEVFKDKNAVEGQGFGDFLKEVNDREMEKRRTDEVRRQNMRAAMDRAGDW